MMMNRIPGFARFIELLFLLEVYGLLNRISAHNNLCFFSEISTKKSIYKMDVIAYDLATVSTGSDLNFAFSESSKFATIRPTFRESEKHEPLSAELSDCYAHVAFNNSHYMYLCDQFKIAFVGYDEVTGDVIENRNGLLDSSLNCSSLISSKHSSGRIFAICLNYTNKAADGVPDLVIAPIDYTTLLPGVSVSVPQDSTTAFGGSVQAILFDDYTQTVNLSYIYVFDPKVGPFQFQMFTQNIATGAVQHTGLFTSLNDIEGLISPSHLLGMAATNESLLLVLVNASDSANKNFFLQGCSPRLSVDKKFVCTPSQNVSVFPNIDGAKYALHKVAGKTGEYQVSFANTSLLVAYNVLLDLSAGVSQVAEVDISPSGFDSIRGIFLGNDRIYLTGNTESGSNQVLVYRTNSGEWEKQVFIQTKTYGVNFIRKGLYDPDVDEHILIYEGKTYYSLVDRPELIIFPFQTSEQSVSVTVECSSGGKVINSKQVQLDILQEINQRAYFALPESIDAYEKSSRIVIPISSSDAAGNAPNFKVEFKGGDLQTNLTATVEYIYEVERKYTGDPVNNVLDLYYLGERGFIAETANSINFLKCYTGADSKLGYCSLLESIKFFNRQVLAGTADENYYMTLEASTYVSGSENQLDSENLHQAKANNVSYTVRPRSEKQQFEVAEPNLRGIAGTIKLIGTELHAVVVGTFDSESQTQYLLWSIFDMQTYQVKTKFTKLMKFPSNMCIKEVMFSPRTREKLFVSSCCNGNRASSRVYEIDIKIFGGRGQPPIATLGRIFSEISSTEFMICPTRDLLAIVDYEGNAVFSFELSGSENTKLQYEARLYGIDEIKHSHCDQENNILQILGVKNKTEPGEEKPAVKMVTYKIESMNKPQSRVHSVQRLDSAVVPQFIASAYNWDEDHVSTVLMGGSTDNFTLIHLIVTEAPVIYINTSLTTSGNYTATCEAVYPGTEDVSISKPVQLRLVPQRVAVDIKPKSGAIQLPKTGTLNLDAVLEVVGPVQQFVLTKSAGVGLTDRMYPTEMLSNVTLLFDQIATDGTVVLGYKKEDTLGTMKLLDTITLKVLFEKPGYSLVDMGAIKGGTGFFALVMPDGAVNPQLLLFVKLLSGKWSSLVYSLQSSGIQSAIVHYAFNNSFVVATYNNEELNINVLLITMKGTDEDNMIFFNHDVNIRYEMDIVDFDFVKLDQYTPEKNYSPFFLLVTAEVQSTNGQFRMYKINNSTGLARLEIAGLQDDTLIPGERVVHNQVDFSCESVSPDAPFTNQSKVTCFHNSENLYSYFVQYNIETINSMQRQKFVNGSIIRKVRNIANLNPIRSAVSGSFGAVVVENRVWSTYAPEDSIYSQSHLLLVYNFDYQDDPYKLVTWKTLGLPTMFDLRLLEPQFFKPTGSSTQKLAVNIGVDKLSMKVFNLGPLTLVINDGSASNDKVSLVATQIDGTLKSVSSDGIWKWDSSGKTDPADRKKKALMSGVIIIVFSICALVGYVFITKCKGSNDQDFEDGYRTAATMIAKGYENESTMKTDETSSRM